MKRASVRDLRYDFPVIEAHLRDGKPIEITKRRRVIARLIPVRPVRTHCEPPDFIAMLKEIYGDKVLAVTGAELVAEQRGRY